MGRGTILAGGAVAAGLAAGAFAAFSPPADRGPGAAPPAVAAEAERATASGGDSVRGEAVFRICSACHTVGRQGADVDGPNLYGVVGARVAGRRPRYGYTQALRDIGGTWTEARLNAWLTDPAAVAPGTAMRFAGLPDAADRADVIAYLATRGPSRP